MDASQASGPGSRVRLAALDREFQSRRYESLRDHWGALTTNRCAPPENAAGTTCCRTVDRPRR